VNPCPGRLARPSESATEPERRRPAFGPCADVTQRGVVEAQPLQPVEQDLRLLQVEAQSARVDLGDLVVGAQRSEGNRRWRARGEDEVQVVRAAGHEEAQQVARARVGEVMAVVHDERDPRAAGRDGVDDRGEHPDGRPGAPVVEERRQVEVHRRLGAVDGGEEVRAQALRAVVVAVEREPAHRIAAARNSCGHCAASVVFPKPGAALMMHARQRRPWWRAVSSASSRSRATHCPVSFGALSLSR
jgi:hypothetical protein